MTTSDKKKVVLLILLVAVGAALYIWMYRSTGTKPAAANAAKAATKGATVKPGQEAQILLKVIEGVGVKEAGRRNLFQYQQKIAAKPPEPPRIYVPPVTPNVAPPPPQPPPPPPFKSFRYEGFSSVKDGGKLLASITESGNTYTVREGECLMGQYCISKLDERMVEIEDLQLKRKQTFMRSQ
jgi:hypothetical protein